MKFSPARETFSAYFEVNDLTLENLLKRLKYISKNDITTQCLTKECKTHSLTQICNSCTLHYQQLCFVAIQQQNTVIWRAITVNSSPEDSFLFFQFLPLFWKKPVSSGRKWTLACKVALSFSKMKQIKAAYQCSNKSISRNRQLRMFI